MPAIAIAPQLVNVTVGSSIIDVLRSLRREEVSRRRGAAGRRRQDLRPADRTPVRAVCAALAM